MAIIIISIIIFFSDCFPLSHELIFYITGFNQKVDEDKPEETLSVEQQETDKPSSPPPPIQDQEKVDNLIEFYYLYSLHFFILVLCTFLQRHVGLILNQLSPYRFISGGRRASHG